MSSRFLRAVTTALLAVAVCLPTAASALSVGYASIDPLIARLASDAEVQKKLEDSYAATQNVLKALSEEFEGKLGRLESQRSMLSAEKLAEREQELARLQQQFNEKQTTAQQDLAELEVELLSPIYTRINQAIENVAKTKGLDLVLRSQAGSDAQTILFVNQDKVIDITLELATALGINADAQADSTGAPAAAPDATAEQ